MALEITNTWNCAKSGNPVLIATTGPTYTTLITKSQLTGGTVTNVDTYNTVDVSSGASGRAFIANTLTLKANTPYVIMARFESVVLDGAATENRMCVKMTNSADLTLGDTSATVAGSGIYAIVVQYGVEKTVDFRIGTGANSAVSNCSARISGVTIFELPAFVPVGGNLPPIRDYSGVTRGHLAFATEFANSYDVNGLVTEAAQTVALSGSYEKYRVGVYVSDSFGNDVGDWPNLLSYNYKIALCGGSWSGQTMEYFNARATDVFTMSGVTQLGDAIPDFALIQSSLNSVNSAQTASQMLTTMSSLIDKARSAGLKPFCLTITPFGAGMTTTEREEREAYNASLQFLCASKNAVYIDISDVLSDPADRKVLLAAYDSGDGIHPNSTGWTAYANFVAAAIERNRLVQSSMDVLTAKYRARSSLIPSIIGSIVS